MFQFSRRPDFVFQLLDRQKCSFHIYGVQYNCVLFLCASGGCGLPRKHAAGSPFCHVHFSGQLDKNTAWQPCGVQLQIRCYQCPSAPHCSLPKVLKNPYSTELMLIKSGPASLPCQELGALLMVQYVPCTEPKKQRPASRLKKNLRPEYLC